MGDAGFKLENFDDVLKNLDGAGERLVQAAAAAVYGDSIALIELVNRKMMVPVQTGALKNSAYVTLPGGNGGGSVSLKSGTTEIRCEIGYGAPYAEKVHEDPTRAFSRTTQDGHGYTSQNGYKFLERAANIHARAMLLRINEQTAVNFTKSVKPSDLAGLLPTSPQYSPTGQTNFTRAQRRNGFSKQQAAQMRRLKKAGALRLVRRWKTPRKRPLKIVR